MTTQKRPYANSRFATYLQQRILELRPIKSQIQIATEAGFAHPNMLSMFKSGASRLPLDRVPAFAKALDADPALVFKMALEQSGPTTAEAMAEIFGVVVTKNEAAWIEEMRDASDHSNPRLTTRSRAAFRAIFEK